MRYPSAAPRRAGIAILVSLIAALVLALVAPVPTASAAAGQIALTGHVGLGSAATSAGAGEVRVHYLDVPSEFADASSPWVPTDAQGDFTIVGDPGPYTLFFQDAASTSFASMYWNGPSQSDITVINATSDVGGLNISLPPRAVVSGQVSLGAAGAHPGTAVTYSVAVRQGSGYSFSGPTGTTSADGRFSVPLDPGSYEFLFSAPGYQSRYWDGSTTTASETGFAVATADVPGVDPVLPATGSISGHVSLGAMTHAAAAGQVKVSWEVGGTDATTTDADGDYSFTGLSYGSYSLTFEDVADHDFQQAFVSATVSSATPDPVADATLPTMGSIVGTVFLGDTAHPAGAGDVQVTFLGPDSDAKVPAPLATTDAVGHYAITGLTAANYTLYFHYVGTGSYADEWWSQAFSYETATPTAVSSGPVTRDVTLPAAGGISGRLVGPTGGGRIADVVAHSSDVGGSAAAEVHVISAADGTFDLPHLAPGTYFLSFHDTDVPGLPDQWYQQTPGTIEGQAIVVGAGTTHPLGDVALHAGGSISGTVTCTGSCEFSVGDQAFYELDGRDSSTSPWVPVRGSYTPATSYNSFAVVPGEYRVVFRGPTDNSCAPADSGPFTIADGQSLTLPPLAMHCGSAGLPSGPPFGMIDSVGRTGPTSAVISGWALDPDSVAAIWVFPTVDGVYGDGAPADATRNDVAAVYPGYGAQHGYSLTLTSLSPGPHTVCVVAEGTDGRNVTLGCRSVTATAYPSGPLGSFDSASVVYGGVRVTGWAVDPTSVASSFVLVDVDGAPASSAQPADTTLGWFDALYPGFGTNHGFDTVVPASPGAHRICIYGPRTLIGCRTVTVPPGAGNLDSATGQPGGVHLTGWSYAENSSAPSYVWVNVDGVGGPALADKPLPWIDVMQPGIGTQHGFDITVAASPGRHQVCAYGAAAMPLGCRTVDVSSPVVASFDSATGVVGGVHLTGWSVDVTHPATSQYMWVNVDGRGGPVLADALLPWFGALYSGAGPAHGLDTVFAASPGAHQVCLYGASLLGCRTVFVPDSDAGSLDSVVATSGGYRVQGWSIDLTRPSSSSYIWINVDGAGGPAVAGAPLGWFDALYPGAGPDHGFDVVVPASPGVHQVCVYGTAHLLGCRRIATG